MKLTCPNCSATIPAEDVHLERVLAKCARCDAVFSFADRFPEAARAAGTTKRPQLHAPARVEVRDLGADKALVVRWFRPAAIFLAFFTVFWNAFLLFWYGVVLSQGAPLVMALFPLLHVAVGLFLAYLTAALFVNSTRIVLTRRSLSVRHGPLPWPGNKALEGEALDQLFTREQVHHGKNGTQLSYDLVARSADGVEVVLVRRLEQPEEGLFLEQTLERWMGIEDRPVATELAR